MYLVPDVIEQTPEKNVCTPLNVVVKNKCLAFVQKLVTKEETSVELNIYQPHMLKCATSLDDEKYG